MRNYLKNSINLLLYGVLSALLNQSVAANTIDGYLDNGRNYLNQGQFNSAVIELRNVLQKDPFNSQAHLLLSETYLRMGKPAAAEIELKWVRDLGVSREKWIVLMARIYLASGQYEQLLEEIVLDQDDSMNIRSSLLAIAGSAYVQLEQIEQANDLFKRALTLSPTNIDALLGAARLALQNKNLDKALSFLDTAIQEYPKHIEAWIIKGDIKRLQEDYSQAIDAFNHVLELQPGNVIAKLGRAETLLAQNELEQAMEDVESVHQLLPNLHAVNFLLARLFILKGDFANAQTALQSAMAVIPDHMPSHLLSGIVSYSLGDMAQADNSLTIYTTNHPDNVMALKLLAIVKMNLGELQRAIEYAQSALAKTPNDALLLALIGSAYQQTGDYEKGYAYLDKAIEIDPNVAAPRAQIALSHFAEGDMDKALTELENAVDLRQDLFQADVLLILMYLQNKSFDSAIEAASRFIAKLPNQPIPYNLRGIVYFTNNNYEKAQSDFEKALRLQPDFSPAAINLAKLELSIGNTATAKGIFQKILEYDHKNLKALLGLADIAAQQDQPIKALNWLEKALSSNPDSLEAGLKLTQQHLANGDSSKALNLVRRLNNNHPNHPQILRILGFIFLSNGEISNALVNFLKLTKLESSSAEAWYFVAAAHLKAKNYNSAEKALDKVLSIQKDHLPSLSMKAQIQLLNERFDEALRSARHIQHKYPDAAEGYKLEGDISFYQKEYLQALSAYQTAYDTSADAKLALQIAKTQWQTGKTNVALKFLRDWLAKEPANLQVRAQLADYLQKLGHRAEAIVEYEMILQQQPNNPSVLNNLAWLYNELENPISIRYAEKAVELSPDQPEITDTLGWILLQNGQPERALSLLQQAAVMAPHITDIRYHLVLAYVQNGHYDKARRELETLLNSGKPFDDINEARKLLDSLKKRS